MILFINACARPESRTHHLAEKALKMLKDDDVVTLNLYDEKPTPMDNERLTKRNALLDKKDYSDPIFRFANQFKEADTVLIAAPYWDLSFPSILKCYVEAICADGLTFYYDNTGTPRSLCKVKKLIYVMTAGGPVPDSYNMGFEYFKNLFGMFFEVKDSVCFKAEELDIWGNDPEAILKKAEEEIESTLA